jgi:hypothetical protein
LEFLPKQETTDTLPFKVLVRETTGGGFETLRGDKTQFYFQEQKLTEAKINTKA